MASYGFRNRSGAPQRGGRITSRGRVSLQLADPVRRREKRSISPDMAVLLSAYFGTSDGYWINLQAHFDLEMAKT